MAADTPVPVLSAALTLLRRQRDAECAIEALQDWLWEQVEAGDFDRQRVSAGYTGRDTLTASTLAAWTLDGVTCDRAAAVLLLGEALVARIEADDAQRADDDDGSDAAYDRRRADEDAAA